MRRLPAILVFCAFFAGCSRPPLTEIILEVDSEFPAGELDMVRVEVVRGTDVQSADVDLAAQSFPFTQGLVHRNGLLGPVSIAVEGSYNGRSVVRQLRSTAFVVGQSERMRIVLSPACIGVVCPDGEGCTAGRCVGTGDGGVSDAGNSDAAVDVSLADAPGDAPTDAPRDAGVDANSGDAQLLDSASDAPVVDASGCPADIVSVDGPYTCADGCACTIECQPGATCEISCGGRTRCDVMGLPRSTVQLDCEGADECRAAFRPNTTFVGTCSDASCVMNCANTDSCDVSCGDDATCTLACPSSGACAFSMCADETVCSPGRYACNRGCE